MTNKLFSIFKQIEDNRRDLSKLHDLNDILVMAIIAVICGADTWNNIEEYCEAKSDWLSKFLNLKNGIPSHDTFNRVISAIDSNCFERCFTEWVSELIKVTDVKEIVNIDGKTIRGAKVQGKKSPIHMVSAWASHNNLVLGQVKVNEKSNEITAIPELLEALSLQNSIVTIDAMGCQKTIAEMIIEKEADYVLAVKKNKEKLFENIEDEFRFSKAMEVIEDTDLGHGRIETRKCSVINDFQHIEDQTHWAKLKSIIKIESTREFKNSDKPIEKAIRYYISSLAVAAIEFQYIIRSHWNIENKLHWSLDVAFMEDQSRKRQDNAAQNLSILTKIALNLLKNEKTAKVGLKGKRLKAGWDNNYLEKLIKE
ncbi:ISAs1 family transposase [Flavobacterium psychrotrophum]|uniref:ISAs1 family transposase n=1 Tax=Flavobacterium psychrotrophum TaxID=2294119 RepID=UPI000E30DE5F|nr:ISAs1 family transposase [Flavobacterium psychrotrophum]